MKILFLSAAIAFASFATTTNADVVIFDAVAGDAVGVFSNGANPAPTLAIGATTGSLSQPAAQGQTLAHMVGSDDIMTLNGGGIQLTDTVTVTWVVDSIVGFTGENDNSNGIEFGLVSNPTFRNGNGSNPSTISRFRGDDGAPTSPLANSNRVGNGFGSIFNGTPGSGQSEDIATVEGTGLEGTALSFEDGFTVVQTLSAAGVTTQYSDIIVTDQAGVETGGTTLTTVIQPFAATGAFSFQEFVNGAHFYAGTEFDNLTTGGEITFSTATIDVATAVPEPSSAMLLVMGGIAFGIKRRRK